MSNSKWFLIFIISFLAGILFGDIYLSGEKLKILVFILVSIYFVRQISGFWRIDFLKLFILCVLFVVLGAGRFFISFDLEETHVINYLGDFQLKGVVVDVDVRSDKVKYVIDVDKILLEEEEKILSGRILVTGERYPVYNYGDYLLLEGEIQHPDIIEDFDYQKYLSRYSIYSVMYRAEIKKLAEGMGNDFFKYIFYFKGIFENRLGEYYAEPHASFMAGLILGSRRGIPSYLMEDFNTTGLTHIIAISGYNITLVIVVVSSIFSFLTRRVKAIVSGLFIVVFVILVGASAAVVRAGIMGCISLLALFYGRQYFVIQSLFIAAFLMNIWNPKILVYDVGFQLSFLATLGIIIFSSVFEKYFKCVPEIFGVRESILMTLSAQVLALPVIVLNFGRLSLISPIANVFVLPFIPVSMIFGFFSVLISFFSEFLGNLVGFFGYLVLEIVLFLVRIFAKVKFASLDIGFFSWWMLVSYYFFLFRKLFFVNKDFT